MANEITFNYRMTATKGSITRTRNRSFNADWNTAKYDGKVQNIAAGGTAGVALTFAALTTGGLGYFTNLDTTNFVEIGLQVAGTFYPFAKLKAGESYPFRLAVLTLYARANTAAVDLEYEALND